MNEGTLYAVVAYTLNEDEELEFDRYERLFKNKKDALFYSNSCALVYELSFFNVEPLSYEIAKAGGILDLLKED